MPALLGFKSARKIITAPTYVGAGTSSGGDSTTITPTLPVGWAQNDILIIMLSLCGSTDPSAPSGYTRLPFGSYYSTTSTRSIMFWKRAGSSESNPSISWPAGNALYSWVAKVYAFRGCSTTDPPYNVYSNAENYQTSSPPKPRFPFINITVDKVFVFGAISNLFTGGSPGSFTATNNAGLTSTLTDQFYTTGHRTISASAVENCFGGVQSVAGTLGEVILDFSGSASLKGQNVIALIPAS